MYRKESVPFTKYWVQMSLLKYFFLNFKELNIRKFAWLIIITALHILKAHGENVLLFLLTDNAPVGKNKWNLQNTILIFCT